MQFLVGHTVYKQRDDSRSLNSLADPFEVDQSQKQLWPKNCDDILIPRVNPEVRRACNPFRKW